MASGHRRARAPPLRLRPAPAARPGRLRRFAGFYRAAYSGLPADVWWLCAVALLHRSGNMVLPFLTLYLTIERGLSATAAGAVLGLYGVGSMGGSWLGGWLADRLDPRRAQLAGLVTGGASLLVLGVLRDVAALSAGVFVTALLVESLRPANMAALARRMPVGGEARAFAALRLAANLGWGIGPALGGVLATRDYGWLFVGNAAACWLAALMLAVAVPRAASGAAADAAPEAGAAVASPRSPWRDPPFLALMVWTLALVCVLFQVLGALPLYLREIHRLDESAIGALLAVNAALIVSVEMVLIHWLEPRGRPWRAIGAGVVLLCAGFGMLPLANGIPLVVVSVAVWSVGEMLALPLLNGIVARRAPRETMGSYMGVYTVAFSLAAVLGPPAGTLLYARVAPDAPWYACAALALPLLVGLRLLAPRLGRPPVPAAQ